MWPSFALSAMLAKTTGVGHETGLQHYNIMIDSAHIRSQFFDVRRMKDLLDLVTPSTILLYVRAVGLFSRCNLVL